MRHGPERCRLAIVGGGFSGATLAARLSRSSTGELEVDLFEPSGRIGAGVAFSTPHPYHLLNVPAGKMSADPDRPDEFVDFLEHRRAAGDFDHRELDRWGAAAGARELHEMFVPRRAYADYVAERFSAAPSPFASGVRVRVVAVRVDDLNPSGDAWSVGAGSFRGGPYDAVVLATGNAKPRRLLAANLPAVHEDPWDWDRFPSIDANHDVLLIGTGLTMVDALLTLRDQGHRGRLIAVSTRGLLPRPHRIGIAAGTYRPDVAVDNDPLARLHAVRRHLRANPDEGWRHSTRSASGSTSTSGRTWSAAMAPHGPTCLRLVRQPRRPAGRSPRCPTSGSRSPRWSTPCSTRPCARVLIGDNAGRPPSVRG